MKKMCVIVSLVIILLITGCRGKVDIDINDYRPLENYTFQENDFIMRKGKEEIDILGGIYSLKGLSPYEYVAHIQNSIYGNRSKTLYCNNDAQEPILCIDPCEIEIFIKDEQLTIKDKTVVRQLVDVIRTQKETTYFKGQYTVNFVFDVRCDLKWECSMLVDEKDIKMIWNVSESNQRYIYDITDILEQHSIAEDIYSLLEQ